jgi:hypothetical protein
MSSKLVVVFVFLALLRGFAQTVVNLAGSSFTSGHTNGVGTVALFNIPVSVAVDTAGAVIVGDINNHKVRLVYPNRTVITLAGGNSSGFTQGSTDGVGTAALFNGPIGVAVDTLGNVIVADTYNFKIRLIYSNLTVITLAGGSTTGILSGSTDGVGTAALFNLPYGVAVDDASGAVFVADRNNHKIRVIHPNRTVVTLAGGGSTGATQGSAEGRGTAALFFNPTNIAVGASGAAYVADTGNHKICVVHPNGTVITLAGGGASGTAQGVANGLGSAALFATPRGVAVGASGAVYVAELATHKIRFIFPNRTVITLAGGGSAGNTSGYVNSVGTDALFNQPIGVAVDATGAVFVADYSTRTIRLIYPFSCAPGAFANFTSRSCAPCPPGSFSSARSAPSCPLCLGGTFAAKPFGSTSCDACPAGYACPPGTSSWARLNCGRGNYCPDGSAEPIPCPIQIVPVPYASWASHPLTAQGPAFLVETASCLNHCFWNFTSGDGMLSKC